MSQQPEALRLADALDKSVLQVSADAAAELRRLHGENQQLREANEAHDQRQKWWNEQLFQRQQEVERLRDRLEINNDHPIDGISARDETIRLLEQEHDEDQRVIAVWRGRCERLEQSVQEPVAWLVYTEGGKSAYVTDNPTDLIGAYRALPLYTAPAVQPAVPQWIACSERMPDVSQDCVVVVLGVVMPAEWIDQKFITWRSYNHPTGADEINDVTHWMPLPEPPTGGKHD